MRKLCRGLFRMLLSFFAGVLVTFYLLVPGGHSPVELLNPAQVGRAVDFDRAGQKLEQAGDLALLYAVRAKDYIKEKISDDEQPNS
ncbi:MAG: hypothetical protein JXD22_10985 [Sedimentisphaerales bacterium]|nr:hypothetical protein [Sedimentisphaerales bacterium]